MGSTATSSSGGSQKSHANGKHLATGQKNRGYQSDDDKGETSRRQRKQRRSGDVGGRRQINRDIDKNPDGPQTDKETIVGGIKRSSQSSQGSTDSNHSSHVSHYETVNSDRRFIMNLNLQSASSGSLLLTAANLEQLAQIHKKMAPLPQRSTYNANITLNPTGDNSDVIEPASLVCYDAAGNESVIIPIDHNMIQLHLQQQRIQNSNKTKDVDAMSLASSTHFTMVNGMGGPQRVTKDGLCSRGHQITVLILTMSLVFLIGICGAVFMLECKYHQIEVEFQILF